MPADHTPRILYAGAQSERAAYAQHLPEALSAQGVEADVVFEATDPGSVDFIVYAPDGPVQDLSPFTNVKAVLSLWAGVERIVTNPTLTQPLCRMVDSGLERGMTEWVLGHVLRHHLGMDQHILGQDGVWRAGRVPPLAADRSVTILGLGALGRASAMALKAVGFEVSGWTRSARDLPGIRCHSGEAGLKDALSQAQILVLLLPQTADTRHVLNAQTLGWLPRGAIVINPGRGPLIDDTALLAALDSGQIGHATLDVFEVEPLPADHPYWAHPKVTVTPHIAATTRPKSAAQAVAGNVARSLKGQPLLHQVDRTAGY